MHKYLKAGSRLSIFHQNFALSSKSSCGQDVSQKGTEQTIPNQLFLHVSRWDKCHMLLPQTQPLPKACAALWSSQATSHSRGSVCKDSSETKVQITSMGTLISPMELTPKLINYLQDFWSALKHFSFQLYLSFDGFVLQGVQMSVVVPNMLGSSYVSFCISDRNGELWEKYGYLSLVIVLLLISIKDFCLLPAEENKWAFPQLLS